MSNLDDSFELEEDLELRVHPRESKTVSIQIPKDTLESLKKVAANRDMSLEALNNECYLRRRFLRLDS